VLIACALNVILLGVADPRELLLCTFTEKAAFERCGGIDSDAQGVPGV
jgi:ATP-dependent exoDNAse (exonuclease V) beta subunit